MQMGYKHWLTVSGIIFTVLAGSIAVFNFQCDSLGIFSQKSSSSIVKNLLEGKYVSQNKIAVNRVEKIYKEYIRKQKIDVLAIGSSRTMLLRKEFIDIGDANYLNATTGTAKLDHYARVISYFNKEDTPFPKAVIIGIDPWVFDGKISIARFKQLLDDSSIETGKFNALFNYEITKENAKSCMNRHLNSSEQLITASDLEKLYAHKIKHMAVGPNGEVYYPYAKFHRRDAKSVESKVNQSIAQCKQNSEQSKCLHYKALHNFKTMKYFLEYLKQKNVKVIVFFAPFHPLFYDYIVESGNFKQYQKEILRFFRKNGVQTYGSYDPYELGLRSEDFYDKNHPREHVYKKIFRNMHIL